MSQAPSYSISSILCTHCCDLTIFKYVPDAASTVSLSLQLLSLFCAIFVGAQALRRAHFGQGTGPIHLDNLICNSSESSLVNCRHNGIGVHNCGHSEDAGLRCQSMHCSFCLKR